MNAQVRSAVRFTSASVLSLKRGSQVAQLRSSAARGPARAAVSARADALSARLRTSYRAVHACVVRACLSRHRACTVSVAVFRLENWSHAVVGFVEAFSAQRVLWSACSAARERHLGSCSCLAGALGQRRARHAGWHRAAPWLFSCCASSTAWFRFEDEAPESRCRCAPRVTYLCFILT